MSENTAKKSAKKKTAALIAGVLAVTGAMVGILALVGNRGGMPEMSDDMNLLSVVWPSVFDVEPHVEPPFEDDPNRTNNAFNVIDFGEQGTNGWFYRYGDSKRPQRSEQIKSFDGEKYFQSGANGLEIKRTFLHTSEEAAPILEWRVAEDGRVDVKVTYVKSVNGDANPGYPDGVQLMIYKGTELLKFENVPISTEEENLVRIDIDDLEVKEDESLYFVVDPNANNAFDGGSLYAAISDVNADKTELNSQSGRPDNNANSVEDFGEQGSNGWFYMFGNEPEDCETVSHESEGEYINCTSPNLSISEGFLHPAINDDAVLGWVPAVNGRVDLRFKYTKFEQNDGNPDFPDGVKVKVYKNDELLYEEHVDAPDEGENKIKHRIPNLSVSTDDRFYFMIDAEGNSSYDGGAFDITFIDVNGTTDESAVAVNSIDTRQNIADVKDDFGEQGSNGWIFQWSYEDDPFNAYNMAPFDAGADRYFHDSYLEIKRDYANPGEHDRSPVIKWRVAQNGVVSIAASYTKMKNEDANPAWPDGTRVSIYHNGTLLTQQSFAPEVNSEVTKRLDVPSVNVSQGDYLTMVINGCDNNAYDGGKYEFSIMSLSGLVGQTERTVPATYSGKRVNFASTLDDFGAQGYNGWYYQYGYNRDPFFAVNVERCENGEKYITDDGVEIKKDYIVPGKNGKSANVKWVAAETGRINIDLEYTKLKNEDANPAWPDGVTVLLMKNGQVLRQQYFAPRTDVEVTGSLAIDNVSVNKGDCITMIVDPGENNAYDGGKYMFVIEDADKTPKVTVGNHDNSTSLAELNSIKQGTDGWWFLEGTAPSNAKVLTKLTPDKTGYSSRRTEALEMKKDYVHTGATKDPIYLWVVGKNGNIDVTGSYIKFGQEDPNPSWPDGVTLTIYLNDKVLYSKKVNVRRGDGNDTVVDFNFEKLAVKRGDKLAFRISCDGNFAWDAGKLGVVIEPTQTVNVKPGDDNNTVLQDLDSVEQGTDGWWFLEGTSLGNAKLLTKMNGDKSGYVSRKTESLEMKKDYVHTGAALDPIYQWVVAKNGKIDITGAYTKFGHEDANASVPDGVTLTIYLNNKALLTKNVKALKGDGNDNVFNFNFDALEVKRGDKVSFKLNANGNTAWDAGRLGVTIEDHEDLNRTPGDDNETVLGSISSIDQGTDGWWFLEGTKLSDVKLLKKQSDDKSAYLSTTDSGLEMKKDFVHPGTGKSAFYQWVVKEDGTVDIWGDYTKFGHNDSNPDFPDGVILTICKNDEQLLKKTIKALQGDGNDNVEPFDFKDVEVKANDIISFQIAPNGNNAYDAGRLAVSVGKKSEPDEDDEVEPDPNRTNNTSLAGSFSSKHGNDGWYYGMCDWDSKNFTKLAYDKDNARYYNNGKPELKADFVEPGSGRNAAYKWVVAKDGKIKVEGTYVKFANSDDSSADGTCVRIFVNGVEKKWLGTIGNFSSEQTVTFDEQYEVSAGDEIIFAVNPEGNDSYDGGRLAVTISEVSAINGIAPFEVVKPGVEARKAAKAASLEELIQMQEEKEAETAKAEDAKEADPSDKDDSDKDKKDSSKDSKEAGKDKDKSETKSDETEETVPAEDVGSQVPDADISDETPVIEPVDEPAEVTAPEEVPAEPVSEPEPAEAEEAAGGDEAAGPAEQG